MTYEEECAEALGFSSVGEMNKHQVWLEENEILTEKLRERVRTSDNVIFEEQFLNFIETYRKEEVCPKCNGKLKTKENDRGQVWWHPCCYCGETGIIRTKIVLNFVKE